MPRKDNKGRVLRKGETQRKDGRYAYTYMHPNGKRKTIYAKDILTLREREEKLIKDQLDGIDRYLAGRVTLNRAFDRYIHFKTELKPNTKTSYKHTYDKYVRNTLGTKLIYEIKYTEVMDFYQGLLDSGLSVGTVDRVHCVLHPTFQMAFRDDVIRKNPTDGLMAEFKRRFAKTRTVRHALTLRQQRIFMEYVANSPMYCHWWSAFTVLLGTGMRVGEFTGLRWEDVDFETRLISVNHAIVALAGSEDNPDGYRMIVSTPKTEAGIRYIPMMDSVYEALQFEHDYQTENKIRCKEKIDGMKGFIFFNRDGKVLRRDSLNNAIHRICDEYNEEETQNARREKREPELLPHFSCHSLRHTFATRICENETNLKVIQSIMGHANIETTMDIYAEATMERNTEAIQNLSKVLDVF